jgi:hypothetical protein
MRVLRQRDFALAAGMSVRETWTMRRLDEYAGAG